MDDNAISGSGAAPPVHRVIVLWLCCDRLCWVTFASVPPSAAFSSI